MNYINSIIDAFGMMFSGQVTNGNLMVVSGAVLLIVGTTMLVTSFTKNMKERERMYNELRNN